MSKRDSLHKLLVEFFDLPSTTEVEDLSQSKVANWDSLAMVQLIAELQSTFHVQFDVDEIERLGSYAEIRAAMLHKGVPL